MVFINNHFIINLNFYLVYIILFFFDYNFFNYFFIEFIFFFI